MLVHSVVFAMLLIYILCYINYSFSNCDLAYLGFQCYLNSLLLMCDEKTSTYVNYLML